MTKVFSQKKYNILAVILLIAVLSAFILITLAPDEDNETLENNESKKKLTELDNKRYITNENDEIIGWVENGAIVCFNAEQINDSNYSGTTTCSLN